MRYVHLTQHPNVFYAVTGLHVAEFDELLADVLPQYVDQEQQRLARADRQRAMGAGGAPPQTRDITGSTS